MAKLLYIPHLWGSSAAYKLRRQSPSVSVMVVWFHPVKNPVIVIFAQGTMIGNRKYQ